MGVAFNAKHKELPYAFHLKKESHRERKKENNRLTLAWSK